MENQYCIFYKNDRLQFGWIKEVRKNKLVVVPEQGKEFNCAPSRVEYIWKGKFIPEEKEALVYLSEKSTWVEKQSQDIELELFHELSEPGIAYSLDELAENFLDDHENGWSRVSLLYRLKSDDKLFQQKKSQFIARTEEEIQLINEQHEKKLALVKRQSIEKEWVEFLRRNELPPSHTQDISHWNQFLLRLKNFLVHFENSQEKEYFCNLFNNQMKDPELFERIIINCLANTDQSISWGRLCLLRSSAVLDFDQKELKEVQEVKNKSIEENPYQLPVEDHRSIDTYSVDNFDTKDFDDALSWQEVEENFVLRVYITDVASFISRDSFLFEKASERISSLYTIKEIYPMLYPDLSEGLFSLKEDQDRAAIAFEFKIDSEWQVIETRIFRAIIRVNRNCSYQEVDDLIAEEHTLWGAIWSFCQAQTQKRVENGALELDRIEVKLDISDPDDIKLKSIRENTPSTLVIQELAILSNHLAASYAKEHQLPCLFRNQPPYAISKDLPEGEKPKLKDINIQPARVGLSPEGHSALGLDCYLQITSPIRRFLDLINQSILFSHLAGKEVPFSEDELLEWARLGDEVQREYNQLERRLQDHWKIKYLSQNSEELYQATLVRYYRSGRALVNLTSLQLYIESSLKGIEQGAEFLVTIDSVNPDLNKVVLRPVHQEVEVSQEAEVEE